LTHGREDVQRNCRYSRRHDLAKFGGLPDVAMLIADSGLDADVAARLEAAGPTVVRA
jgi:hypothetical protein